MKKTKWIAVLAAVLAIVLAFGLSACGKKKAKDGKNTPPAPAVTFEAVEAVPATCTAEGTEAYWKGSDGKLYSDKDGKKPIEKPVSIPKIALEKVAEVPATCTAEGAKEHWKCPKCGKLYADEAGKTPIDKPVSVPKIALEHRDAVAPTFASDGNVEYWECPKCHKKYSSAEASAETETADAVLPKHTLTHHDKVEATCKKEGTEEYWEGSNGKLYSDDKAGTEIAAPAVLEKVSLVHHAAVAATHETAGNVEYWECPKCHKKYADDKAGTEIENVFIPKIGLTRVEEVHATCTAVGFEAYYRDDEGNMFSDAQGKNPINKLVVIPKLKLTKVEEVPATCTKEGAKEHWKCPKCGKLYADEAGQTPISKAASIAKIALEHHDAVAPTFASDGSVEYWECPKCHKKYSSSDASAEITDTVVPMYTLTHHEKVDATCTKEGTEEYWEGSNGKLYSDDKAGTEIAAPAVIGKIALIHHAAVAATHEATGTMEYWECPTCHKKYADANAETEIEDVLIPVIGITKVEKIPATCISAGTETYYKDDAGKLFSDAEGNNPIDNPVSIPKVVLEHHDAVAPTFGAAGNVEYWECPVCHKKYFSAEASAETEITDVSLAMYTLTAVPAVSATCTADGTKAYWKGSDGKLYSDAEGTTEIEAPEKIPALGHDFVWKSNETEHWKGCSRCDAEIEGTRAAHNFSGPTLECECGRSLFTFVPDNAASPTRYTVTGYTGEDTAVVIPSEYRGKPVTKLAFADSSNKGIVSLTVPSSVTEIGDKCCYKFNKLETVTLTEGLKTIGSDAFCYCTSLVSMEIPSSVTVIVDDAFRYCEKLETVTLSDGLQKIDKYVFSYCGELKDVVIPESVTSIGEYAFIGCTSLTSVTIPKNVQTVGSNPFNRCSGLESITVDPENQWFDGDGNCLVEKSTGELFSGCKNSVIPDGVKIIGYYAFINCKGLTSITIPDSVTRIASYAFQGCAALKTVTFSGTPRVTQIFTSAFSGCTSLVSIILPAPLTKIDNTVFANCTSLTSITIPDTVSNISSSAFAGCSSLADIRFNGTKARWESVSKDTDWAKDIAAGTVVHCSDGDVGIA